MKSNFVVDQTELEKRKQRAIRFRKYNLLLFLKLRDKIEDPRGIAKFKAPAKKFAHHEKLISVNKDNAHEL